jgi:hypothetical protein
MLIESGIKFGWGSNVIEQLQDMHVFMNNSKILYEVGSFQHGMVRPRVADGADGLKIWRVAAKILNKESRTAEKGWSFSLGVERGANNSLP